MIAAVYVPLWTLGVAFIALCFVPDVFKVVKRRAGRRSFRGVRARRGFLFLAPPARAGTDERAA